MRFLGLNWSIYGLPFSGCVQSSFYTTDNYRLRNLIFIAGGPLMNALFLVIGIALIYLASPPIQVELLVAWIFANGWLFVHALTPNMIKSYGQMIPNDGLCLWRIVHQSDDEIRRIVAQCVTTRDLKLDNAATEKMSVEELLVKHQAAPENIVYLWHLTERFRVGNDPRYLEQVMKLITFPQVPEHVVVDLIDTCLTWQLHLGPPENPAFSDELSQRLLEKDNNVSTRGTRGSVLVNIGRVAEGRAILQEVLDQTQSNVDKGYSLVFLALAFEAEGNLNEARAHAIVAKETDPGNASLKRVARLLEPKQRRS